LLLLLLVVAAPFAFFCTQEAKNILKNAGTIMHFISFAPGRLLGSVLCRWQNRNLLAAGSFAAAASASAAAATTAAAAWSC